MGESRDGENRECCGAGDCDCESLSKKNTGPKTFIFSAIIVLAAAIAVYSLFFKSAGAGKAGCLPGAAARPQETLSTIPALNDRIGELDFVFVVLDDSKTDKISQIIESSLSNINSAEAGVIVMGPDDELFATVADQYAITGFPAVLSLGRYGNKLLIRGNITMESLIQAHKLAATAPAPCC